jgi:hypothetical protein
MRLSSPVFFGIRGCPQVQGAEDIEILALRPLSEKQPYHSAEFLENT